VSNLLDMNSPTEAGLLCVVALESDPVLVVGDAVCCNRRMVADLFRYQLCTPILVVPMAKIKLSKERVERLLLRSQLF